MTLEVVLDNLKLKNPVVLASGTFDRTITKHINVSKLGAITTKTITLKPREGNPLPHIIKTKYGWLNSVGLKNVGLKKYLSDELPFWQKFDTKIITSIGGEKAKEYITLAEKLNDYIEAIEVNVSCPNINGGTAFGANPKTLKKLIIDIRNVYKKTLIVKLSPNVTDITEIAQTAIDASTDVLTINNTYFGIDIDNSKMAAKLFKKTGGYSGPAVKPMALRNVYEVYNKFHCPIIGGGGIESFDDALDFIMCGASAVSIGSAQFFDPKISVKIIGKLEKYINDNKIKNLNQIRGVIK